MLLVSPKWAQLNKTLVKPLILTLFILIGAKTLTILDLISLKTEKILLSLIIQPVRIKMCILSKFSKKIKFMSGRLKLTVEHTLKLESWNKKISSTIRNLKLFLTRRTGMLFLVWVSLEMDQIKMEFSLVKDMGQETLSQ